MIEEIAAEHPAVQMAAAVGEPDAYAGELPMLFVTLKPGARVSERELIDFLAGRIHERPALPKRVSMIDTMPVRSQWVGAIVLRTPRVPGATYGQVVDGTWSPG